MHVMSEHEWMGMVSCCTSRAPTSPYHFPCRVDSHIVSHALHPTLRVSPHTRYQHLESGTVQYMRGICFLHLTLFVGVVV